MQKVLKKNIRLGILGGTFDPPHLGHLYISKIALRKFKLNKIIWLITKKNPLKHKPYLNLQKRIKLSKKLLKKEKKIFVKYIEDKIKSKNTFNSLKYISKKNTKIYFLIGSDNLVNLHKWKNWEKISKLAKIVIFPRQNYSLRSANSKVFRILKKANWTIVNSKKMNISSSLIRKFW